MIKGFMFRHDLDLNKILTNYSRIYAVDSMVDESVKYCVSDGKFAVLRPKGAIYCPISEAKDLAYMLRDLKQEILEIAEMAEELGLERTWKSETKKSVLAV